jgi:hypothetical protein
MGIEEPNGDWLRGGINQFGLVVPWRFGRMNFQKNFGGEGSDLMMGKAELWP